MRYCLWGHRRGYEQLKLRPRHTVMVTLKIDTREFARQLVRLNAQLQARS